MANRMLCLGIESSCDETALALVEDGRLVDAVLASQADVHALFGGVVPELASREHYRFVGALFDELMRRSGKTNSDIDLVAAARGPGLLGSLLVGVAFAKERGDDLPQQLTEVFREMLADGTVRQIVSRYLDDGFTLEVNRLCSDGTKNTCSILYAAAARLRGRWATAKSSPTP